MCYYIFTLVIITYLLYIHIYIYIYIYIKASLNVWARLSNGFNIYNQLIITILNIYIYTSLYELIYELRRVELSLLRLIFELGFVFTKRFI
jgi:hypothetical protein